MITSYYYTTSLSIFSDSAASDITVTLKVLLSQVCNQKVLLHRIVIISSTTTEHNSTRETSITHHRSEPSPVTNVTFSNTFGSPPLIPAINFFHTSTLNSVSPQGLLTSTVFTLRSLYELPMSAHWNSVIPTMFSHLHWVVIPNSLQTVVSLSFPYGNY